MTRFERELSGALGEFWRKNAEKEIDRMRESVAAGEICLDDRGGAYWKSSGNYLPSDCVEKLSYTGFDFSPEETDRARDAQTDRLLAEYRANYRGPSPEELAEMRAVFGSGTTAMDVISGELISL